MKMSKEELEAAKIELEIAKLQKPYYTIPSFWISVVTALVAVAGVYGQSVYSKIERAQAVVDRDRAFLATEHAEKELADTILERKATENEISELKAEAEALKAENRNQSEKLASLIAVVDTIPRNKSATMVKSVAHTASKSLFATAVYAFNVDRIKFEGAVSALRNAGYSLIKVKNLDARTTWLSFKSVVLYYDDRTRVEAESVARLIETQTGLDIAVEKGAGIGIPAGKERTSLRVHLVR